MAARSRRLGKGLGALFPTIPEEPVTLEDSTPKPAVEPQPASTAAAAAQAVKPAVTSANRGGGESPAAQKPANAAKPAGEVTGASDEKSAASSSPAETAKPATKAKTSAKHHAKRPSMPSLTESVHPSDMFFADSLMTKTTPDVVPGVPARPGNDPAAKSATPDDDIKPVEGGFLAELEIDEITPNAHQPRLIFDEDELVELSRSIQEVGVLQPIVVRKRHPEDITTDSPARYELIMGERRWRASQRAGLTSIPAIVKTTPDDAMLRDALLENLHRVALNPLEEAAAYQQMLDEFGLTQTQLSKSVSKSRPQIANTLRLLQLPASVQKKLSSGVLSAGHARALLSLPTPEQMEALANRIIAEGLSVRSTEEIVALKTAKDSTKKKRAAKKNVWADSEAVQSLENRFDTKVMIHGTKKRGRIEINFASEEDFNRILNLLNEQGSGPKPNQDGWV